MTIPDRNSETKREFPLFGKHILEHAHHHLPLHLFPHHEAAASTPLDADDRSAGAETGPPKVVSSSSATSHHNDVTISSSAAVTVSDATIDLAENTASSDPYLSSTTTTRTRRTTTKETTKVLDEEEEGKTHPLSQALQYIQNLPETWPRLCSMAFGVVCPVLFLVAISLFFGFFLAQLESEEEIVNNNAVIGQRAQVALVTKFLRQVGLQVGSLCLSSTTLQNNRSETELAEQVRTKLFEIYTTGELAPYNKSSNDTFLYQAMNDESVFEFMRECGATVWNMTEEFTGQQYGTVNDVGSLTFNWIRCYSQADTSGDTFNQIFGSYVRQPLKDVTVLRPNRQEADVVGAWHMDQQQLEEEYTEALSANITDGEEYVKARVAAYRQSIQDADGFDNCEANPDAGAWFWFTIMTTIGYGNTTPKTTEGRVMMYTVGFMSILIFAVVLGNAGRIVTAIFDDWLARVKVLSCVRHNWIMCCFWGGLYYFWMSIVAFETVRWKKTRLDEDFSYPDAYWFAFITTTTVGLGDYYLEHQVVLRRDLIAFSLMILMGFVFLANFLVKLTDLLTNRFPRMKASNLEDRLKTTNMLWHFRSVSVKHGKKLSGRSAKN